MSPRRLALVAQRERLLVRSAALRVQFAVNARELRGPMAWFDQLAEAVHWLRRNPAAPAAAAGVLLVLRPRRVWRLTMRGLAAWRLWRHARPYLQPLVRSLQQGPAGR